MWAVILQLLKLGSRLILTRNIVETTKGYLSNQITYTNVVDTSPIRTVATTWVTGKHKSVAKILVSGKKMEHPTNSRVSYLTFEEILEVKYIMVNPYFSTKEEQQLVTLWK